MSPSYFISLLIAQLHFSVEDASLYKCTDPELPDPDHTQQLIMLCASHTPLPMSHAGNGLSEKSIKLLQEIRDNMILLLAE